MKYLILLLTTLFSTLTSQAIESQEEFKAAVIRTINEKDWLGYQALVFKKGMTDYDLKMMEAMKPAIFDERKIIAGEFVNLTENLWSDIVYDKRIFNQTIEAQGALNLKYETGGDTTLQYAKHGENFVLVASKSQKLDWDGPDDVPLSIMVITNDPEGLNIEASWNTSGINVSKKLSYMSTNFNGQYIEQVTVTSNDPDAVYQLKILQEGKQIFDSKTNKGVGQIKYQRDAFQGQ